MVPRHARSDSAAVPVGRLETRCGGSLFDRRLLPYGVAARGVLCCCAEPCLSRSKHPAGLRSLKDRAGRFSQHRAVIASLPSVESGLGSSVRIGYGAEREPITPCGCAG